MPRSLRIEYPGASYHVMSRGNNGQETFLTDDGRRLFMATLGEVCEQTGWKIHAYVLMANHYHLLLETPEPNLVVGMKWFQGAYTQRFNAMFRRRGHLYQGRYKAIPVETGDNHDYFRRVSTYIHLNPFRAGICVVGDGPALESYRWSSYPAYIGKVGKRPVWLTRERVLRSWGYVEGVSGSLRGYHGEMERIMRPAVNPEVDVSEEWERQIERGWYIGSREFREKLSDLVVQQQGGKDPYPGALRRSHNERQAELILQSGLTALGLTEEEVLTMKSIRLEKQALAWVMKSHTSVTGRWIARRLQMGHPENASRGIRRFRAGESREVKQLKSLMLECVD